MIQDLAGALCSLAASSWTLAGARALTLVAAAALASAGPLGAAESAPKPASTAPALPKAPDELKSVEPFELIKSEFVDDPAIGKDPFFPTSKRREAKVLSPVADGPSSISILLNQVVLKGISGTAGRRLAIINNRSFQVDEVGDIRVNGKLFKIRCLDIKDRSVIIQPEGSSEKKELKLRDGL